MPNPIRSLARRLVARWHDRRLRVRWIRREEGSFLAPRLAEGLFRPPRHPLSPRIEALAAETDRQGPQPLWEGYRGANSRGATRMPAEVRTTPGMGNFYAWLVSAWQPGAIVEFGTAFGVSGMYFLAGIEGNGKGTLYTFDPNETWRGLALRCLSAISPRFVSTLGTFEEHVDGVLPAGQGIDLAFIDAIHTSDFVKPQLELVLARCSDRAIILLDDIAFSDDMRACWAEVARDPRFIASAELGSRVGIVEFRRK